MSNGSGDYVIAFSTAPCADKTSAQPVTELANEQMSPLFLAVVEATGEAIYNSLFKAQNMSGFRGRQVKALPLDTVIFWLKQN